MRFGKWNVILAIDMLVLLAVAICMIDNPIIILVGRLVYGMSAGAFTVVCPKFASEISPAEFRGPFGAMGQFMCTFGILFTALLGLAIPAPADVALLPIDSFKIAEYWRVVWGLPVFFVIVQVTLMFTVFKYDTPVALKQRADYDSLTTLLSKMYVKEQV